jgi:glycosyltransferase involved in cell wall biosynthesis
MAHVVIVGPVWSLEHFRGELIRELVALGHRVTAMSAPSDPDQVNRLRALGADFRQFPIERNQVTPTQDVVTCFALRAAFAHLKPDVVLAYTVKSVIWSGLALRGKREARFVALINGLGFAFQGRGPLRKGLTHLTTSLYRASLRRAIAVIFQNRDNLETFVSRRIVDGTRCHVVNGSGVRLDYFVEARLPDGPPRFLMMARLLSEKGLREYSRAARRVLARHDDAAFQLLGWQDASPDAVPLQEVLGWQRDGVLTYLGETDDVRPVLAACHVFVLPSYHEGMPRSVLEALATGRPILTTDVPGCRDTVVAGDNGYLVPKADSDALAERMIWFLDHRDQWARMGQASRRLAETRFDVRTINTELLRILDLPAPR